MSYNTDQAAHVPDTHATKSLSAPRFLRAGSGEPLVLLHGVLGSSEMWKHVVPLLSHQHDVIALTALGHRGGRSVAKGLPRVSDMVDDMLRSLDELGLERVHVAGNSMGGWMALELARRGRALSVCALSPAGAWNEPESQRSRAILRQTVRQAHSGRKLLPVLGRFAWIRRLAMRDIALHGDRLTRDELIDMSDDVLGCSAGADLLKTDETLRPLSATCPIVLAWSSGDRIFPMRVHGTRARQLVPGARFLVLDGVGHVPMVDDAALVARTILDTVALARPAIAATPYAT
jgi:pimeloyl-ACP methyl ester carboxylesterase